MDKARARFLDAISRLPVVMAAEQEAAAQRCARRRELLQGIVASRQQLVRADSDLVAKAGPIEKRLAALRTEVADLERQLEPLARSRISAMSSYEDEVATLRAELRADAPECRDLQRDIEVTRLEIANNGGGRRAAILNSIAPSSSHISAVLAALLDEYNEAARVAIEEVDVCAALELVRKRLAAAGIRLLE